MSFDKNSSIEIMRVNNGFIVEKGTRGAMGNRFIDLDEMKVFNKIDDLIDFIKSHFPEKEEAKP